MQAKESETNVINDQIVIVALGDSLTEGYKLTFKQAYPALLEKIFQEKGRNVRIINHGVSGDTTSGGRSRLVFSLKKEPDIVIVELGPNDFLRGLPPMLTRENLESIVKTLTEKNIEVLLIGFKNIHPSYGEYSKQFADIFPYLQEKYDIHVAYNFLENVAGVKELNLEDGIHPNAEGHKIVANNLLPHLEILLDGLEQE